MLLVSALLILTVTLTEPTDAATTYNLALLQDTLEVIGEDIIMFITSKLNGDGNTADDDESLYDTADEQPEGIDDEEDDEEGSSSEDGGNAASKPETDRKQHGQKTAWKDEDGIVAESNRKPKTEEKKKYVTDITKSKEPSPKSIKDPHTTKGKEYLNNTVNEDGSGESTEETAGNEEEEEEEPDMAEALASVAVNVAAQKFKEHLGKLNIQLK